MRKQQWTQVGASCLLILIVFLSDTNGQRVAPGVPPQHYQQVPVQAQQYQHPPAQQYQQQQVHVAPGVAPQQYQQQTQVQYQQVPVQQQQQYQQVPQVHTQQQQQQIPQQQQQQIPQQQQQEHHGHHQPHGQVLNAANVQQERAHIQEHIQVPIDTSKMSEAELQFHYFKMHDTDNNNKLDGCELIKSLIHWHAHEEHNDKDNNKTKDTGTGEREGTVYTDQTLSDVIDHVLSTMDLNNDGYVDYAEYRKGEEASTKGTKP